MVFFYFLQRVKENKEPTQVKKFIETRKGDKGKKLDAETKSTIVS